MKTKIILLLIILLGLVLRFYKLSSLPAILNRDEAAIAFNAHLLNQVQKDEWGKSWPVILESFGDYKLPGYPYFTAAVFNLAPANDLSVRLGSFLAGVILILVAFQIAQHSELLHRQSLHFALLIAISPVFFFYSRIAFEANFALMLFVASLFFLLFIEASKTKRLFFDVLAILLLLLAVFTYNSPFLLLPFVILVIPVVRGMKKWRKWTLPVLGLLVVFVTSLIVFVPLTSQKSGVTIFSDETTWTNLIQHRQQYSGIAQNILGNKYLFYSQIIFKNFISSFSTEFLVTKGSAHPWHSLNNFGHMHWGVYLFGLLGIIWSLVETSNWFMHKFIYNKKHKKINKRRSKSIKQELLLLYLLFASLFPASVTVDAPHATRSLLFFFIFTLFAVIAIEDLYHLEFFKKFDKKHLLTWFFVFISIFESSHYFYNYFTNYPNKQPESLGVTFDKTIQNLDKKYLNQKIAIVDPDGYQYILTSWYLKLAPQVYFDTVVRQLPDLIGFRYGEQVKNYHFIADREDRSEDERILVEWNGNEWLVTEY
ncbi:MAG: glycosyltransferase family 39 protein [Patescibacteria group bacterium]